MREEGGGYITYISISNDVLWCVESSHTGVVDQGGERRPERRRHLPLLQAKRREGREHAAAAAAAAAVVTAGCKLLVDQAAHDQAVAVAVAVTAVTAATAATAATAPVATATAATAATAVRAATAATGSACARPGSHHSPLLQLTEKTICALPFKVHPNFLLALPHSRILVRLPRLHVPPGEGDLPAPPPRPLAAGSEDEERLQRVLAAAVAATLRASPPQDAGHHGSPPALEPGSWPGAAVRDEAKDAVGGGQGGTGRREEGH